MTSTTRFTTTYTSAMESVAPCTITMSRDATDTVMVQGATLSIALVYVIVNLVVDVLLTVLDPRVRLVRSAS